jgi:porphobilinogen synthase
VDIAAPSAMMDGQVESIREALDDSGFDQTAIMAYSAKYASSFYSPFRDAADSTPKFGSRKSYQMSWGNQNEALREIELDINEGADIVMIKPALAYMDIISLAKSNFNVPIAAYNVSGEYALIKAAAQNGWIDEKTAALEVLTGIKRAGADLIITYFAKDVKTWLNQI